MKKNKSMIHMLLFNEDNENDIKSKNIKQTEILVDLREAVLQVLFEISVVIIINSIFHFVDN